MQWTKKMLTLAIRALEALRIPEARPLVSFGFGVSKMVFIYRSVFEFVNFLRREDEGSPFGQEPRELEKDLNQERAILRTLFKSDEEQAERGCGWPGRYTLQA